MHDVTGVADISRIGDITRQHARTRPDRVAIHFEGQRLTYGELDRRTNQVANGLIAEGVGRQRRIAILSKNGPAFFELWFGAAKVDVVLVPVNFRLAPPEVAFVVEDAGAELLFVGADFYPLVDKVAPELKSVRRIIALDGAHGDWETYTDWVARQSDRDPAVEVAAGNCAIQLYTSGTTGHPKGAQLSHANLLTLLPGALRQFGDWHEKDVNLVCMPLFHIGGSGWGLIGFYRGVESVLMRDADPAAILRLIPEFRITKVFVVPALILFMLQSPQFRATDFSSLELIVYGASPAPVDLVRNAVKVFGCGLAQVYGLTETTGAITYLPPEDHDEHVPARLKSCGKAMTSVELRVVDALDNDVAVGEVGEIICRSPQIMLGYWNQAEATGKAVRSGWFHSGDAGYLDRDGYLYIYDRVKDMIISGGENIYPAEVENALVQPPRRRRRGGDRRSRRQMGRGGEGGRGEKARRRGHARGADGVRPRAHRRLQGAALGRFRRCAAAQPDRKDPQARAAQAVLGRAGAPGSLGSSARSREKRRSSHSRAERSEEPAIR